MHGTRRKRPATSVSRQKPSIPTATLQEFPGNMLQISTRPPKPPRTEKKKPPVVAPPQGEFLAEEYVKNLQQQLYFLDAELRFLKDRAGQIEDSDPGSVDASIRRLRRACAMYEEETNKKIAELESQADEIDENTKNIDENEAFDTLEAANNKEKDSIKALRAAFVDTASEIKENRVKRDHYALATKFHAKQAESIKKMIKELQERRLADEEENKTIQDNIQTIREKRHDLIRTIESSISNKRRSDEEADLLEIMMNQPEQSSANIPLSAIKARNARLEMDIQAALSTKQELEEQVKILLEKYVRLSAEKNIVEKKVEKARSIKAQLDKQMQGKKEQKLTELETSKKELAEIKAERKKLKQQIVDGCKAHNELAKKINQCQCEHHILTESIGFKEEECNNIDQKIKELKAYNDSLHADIRRSHEEYDTLTLDLAEANKELVHISTLVEINSKDPRCTQISPPAELKSLLNNLQAVQKELM